MSRNVDTAGLALLADGEKLVVGSAAQEGPILMHDAATGDQVGEPIKTGKRKWICSVQEPHQRPRLVTGWQNSVRIWDIDRGTDAIRTPRVASEPVLGEELADGMITAMASIPARTTGHWLAVASSGANGHTVFLWDLASRSRIGHPFRRHSYRVTAISGVRLDNGTVLVASGGRDRVHIFEAGAETPTYSLDDMDTKVLSLALFPDSLDNLKIAIGDEKGSVRLWSLPGKGAPSIYRELKLPAPVVSLVLLPTVSRPSLIGAVDAAGNCQIFDSKSGDLISAINLGVKLSSAAGIGTRIFLGSTLGIFGVEFNDPKASPVRSSVTTKAT